MVVASEGYARVVGQIVPATAGSALAPGLAFAHALGEGGSSVAVSFWDQPVFSAPEGSAKLGVGQGRVSAVEEEAVSGEALSAPSEVVLTRQSCQGSTVVFSREALVSAVAGPAPTPF